MKLLILSDFLPDDKLEVSPSFDELISSVDNIVFNLEGSPLMIDSSENVPNQIMPFQLNKILNFINHYGKSKFHIAIANNHILDNGEEGFDYLISFFKKHEINYFGTKETPYTSIGDIKILNIVTSETVASRSLGEKRLNYLFYDTMKINNQITELESKSDKLIFYPHWGRDMDTEVFKTFDHKLKFNKKWLIFGHHPHVLSGIQQNRIYSMGNTYIPHPYYFDKYPATRYGLAIIVDTHEMFYQLKETWLERNLDRYVLQVSDFMKINNSVLQHGKDYGWAKRLFLSLFAFKGNPVDKLRLIALQGLTSLFALKYMLTKEKDDKEIH